MRHTVDTPVHVSVFIANRNGESAKIGTYEIDVGSLFAFDLQ